jgi:hypothetical protein
LSSLSGGSVQRSLVIRGPAKREDSD